MDGYLKETDTNLFLLLETFAYSLKGERGEPGPKGTEFKPHTDLKPRILLFSIIRLDCFFAGDPGTLGQKGEVFLTVQ